MKVYKLLLGGLLTVIFGSSQGFSSAALSIDSPCFALNTIRDNRGVSPNFDAFVDGIFKPILADSPFISRNFGNLLAEIEETNQLFKFLGKSTTRLFLELGNHYTPLSTLLRKRYSRPVPLHDLISKLFRSGYELSPGSGKYADTNDMYRLMHYPESFPLVEALKYSSANKEVAKNYFSQEDAVSPLNSEVGPEFYSTVVIAKLSALYFSGADISSALSGMTSVHWNNADSKSRITIIKHLIGTLGVKSSLNKTFEGGLTPLMVAIGLKDDGLAANLVMDGAKENVVVPNTIDKRTLDLYNLRAGETLREAAARLGVLLHL